MKKNTLFSSVVLVCVVAGCNPDHSGDIQQVTPAQEAQAKAKAKGAGMGQKLPDGVALPPEAIKAMEAAKKNNPNSK